MTIPTPCVPMSSVKSSYTPEFFPLIVAVYFDPFSRRVTSTTFPKVPLGLHEHRIWSDWLTYFIFKRRFKTVLSSQRCFARRCGFYFLDSFSFDVVGLVLCFVKVKKRGVCCNSTYLANRKVMETYGGIRSRWIETACGIPTDAVSQKSELRSTQWTFFAKLIIRCRKRWQSAFTSTYVNI